MLASHTRRHRSFSLPVAVNAFESRGGRSGCVIEAVEIQVDIAREPERQKEREREPAREEEKTQEISGYKSMELACEALDQRSDEQKESSLFSLACQLRLDTQAYPKCYKNYDLK